MPGDRAGPGGRRRRSTTRRGCWPAWATTSRTSRPGCWARRCCRPSSRCGRCRARTLPVPPERVGELRPLTRELRARGLAMSAQAAMESLMRAAAVRPPVPAGDRRLRRPAGAGVHDDARGRWAGSTPTATAPRTSSGRSATPPSPRCSTSPASPPSASRCTGPPSGLPVGSMLVGRPADETTLLALSAQLEAARPWAHRHPASVGATTAVNAGRGAGKLSRRDRRRDHPRLRGHPAGRRRRAGAADPRPGGRKRPRYKPGQPWEHAPVWYEPHPIDGPVDRPWCGGTAHAADRRRAHPDGAPAARSAAPAGPGDPAADRPLRRPDPDQPPGGPR